MPLATSCVCIGVYINDSVLRLFTSISHVSLLSTGAVLNNGRPQKKVFYSQLVQPIGLKFCTHVVGDKMHKLRRQNVEFLPLKIWRPFEFFAYIVSYGTKT